MSSIATWTFPPGDGVPPPAGAYAHVTGYGGVLYVTGQLPVDPATGALCAGEIADQTDQVLRNLSEVLSRCGCLLENTLMARSYLRHESDFPTYDATFRSWFPHRLPSRTTVVVSGFAIPDALIEIDLIAAGESVRV